MNYSVGVKVLPRKEVLDSQGRAVERTLKHQGFENLEACRVGKFITLSIESESKERALSEAKKITEFVLFNPLIEDFELEILGESTEKS